MRAHRVSREDVALLRAISKQALQALLPPRRLRSLSQAAIDLGVSARAVRRMLEGGAPVARAGHRGRGKAALVDPAAIRGWLASRHVAPADDAHLQAWEVFVESSGPHKLAVARAMMSVWYRATTALLDVAGAPELDVEPDYIRRLKAILA